jgi:signal transduction histidine kinase
MRSREAALFVLVKQRTHSLSAERLPRLVEPFARADASTTHRFGGSGLGLAITRQLCELMGGTVTVESVPGAGSAFEIRLPERVA